MAGLGAVVQALAGRDDVAAVVLVSPDGLPIHHAGRLPGDPDAIAALAATFGRAASALTDALWRGTADTVALESNDQLAIAARLGAGDWLIVLPAEGADAGALLFELRHHRAALAALLT
jgi:predicted regulator of Ras-like GTPase activity (Roadblock/LC7/MglB family)